MGKGTNRLQLHGAGNTLGNLIDSLGQGLVLDDVSTRKWLDQVDVDQLGTAEGRNTNVEQENSLEQEIKWNPVEDRARPELNDVQEGKHHPVRQQRSVVGGGGGLQRKKRIVARNNEPGNVRQQLADTGKVQENNHKVDRNTDNDCVRSWKTGLSLEKLQDLNTRGSLDS